MKKLLYVVDNLKGRGGIRTYAENVAHGLDQIYDMKLIECTPKLSYAQKTKVVVAPTRLGAKLYKTYIESAVTSLLAAEEYDLCHFWHIKAAMGYTGTKPYMLTCHGNEILEQNVSRFQRASYHATMYDAAAIVTPSEFTKKYITKTYQIPSRKIKVVHPPIDHGKTKLHKAHETAAYTVGTLTRIVKRKNIANVINATQILKDKGLNVEFRLVGDGNALLKRGIIGKLNKCDFVWKYDEDISDSDKFTEFYPSLDVFVLPVLPSDKDVEGFGIVFIEANASGVPVVASKNGGIVDAVSEGYSGVFADPNSAHDIADKIASVLSTKKKWSKSAYAWSLNFDINRTAKRLNNLYREIV